MKFKPQTFGTRTIALEPISNRNLVIRVDGEVWGTSYRCSHGSQGYSYTVHDIQSGAVYKPGVKRRYESNQWHIWSDKHERYRIVMNTPGANSNSCVVVDPIEVRLPKEINAMIDCGELTSPAVLRERAESLQRKHDENRRRADETEAKALDDKAEEVLAGVWTPGHFDDARAAIKQRIIEAMQWAKSQ